MAAAKFAELIVSECVMRISDWTVRKDDDLVLDCVDLNAALRDHFEFD